MRNNDQLIQLVEQAAAAVTMLSPAEPAEAGQLQSIFCQIDEAMDQFKGDDDPWIIQTKDTVTGVSTLVQKIQDAQTDEASELIDSVTKSVIELQQLIAQSSNPDAQKKTSSQDDKTTKDGSSAQPETIIAEEDIPLVLDFITESCEHIEAAEAGLLDLESKPDDQETLNLIFRSFHTIKGMAGFLNLTEIGSLAHLTENLLDLARKGELLLSGSNTDIVFESIDLLKKMMDGLKDAIENQQPVPTQKLLPQLLEKLEATVSYPNTSSEKTPSEGNPARQTTMQAPRTKPESEAVPPAADANAEPEQMPAEPAGQTNSSRKVEHKTGTVEEKIKVSTTRLDKLVNMAGELMIAQLIVAEEAASGNISEYELNRKISHQGKIVREIQEISMSMRMIQISGVFQKMARLVRDVSRKANKQIKFVTEGEETELDRSLVDKIADPLVHMLRNSVDHGIESPDQRQKAGKNKVGTIELRAFHQTGNIVIEIVDDGKGLDKDRIFKKAAENGIVEPDQQLTDEQIYKLIFHPGLSTAEKVTSVSGRGVGMDVVKKNIESLRGRIDITSTPGKGTTFTIRLPLTLAMIDGQIVSVGDTRYIIPINAIVETLRPEAKQISTLQNQYEMVMVRDQLMPLIRLYRLFDVTPVTEDPTESLLVIVEDDEQKCCVLVDDLLAQQRVVIKNLGDGLGTVDCVSGGAILGDGKVSLILDVPGLIKLSQK